MIAPETEVVLITGITLTSEGKISPEHLRRVNAGAHLFHWLSAIQRTKPIVITSGGPTCPTSTNTEAGESKGVLKDLKVPEALIVEDHKAMCSIANILCAARHMQELGLSRAVVIAQDAQSEKIPTIGTAVAGPDYTFNTFIVPSDTPFTPKERADYVANGRGITKYVARDTVPGNPDTMDIIWDRLQTFEAYGGSVTQNQLLTAAEPFIAAERLIYAREHPAALLPLAA